VEINVTGMNTLNKHLPSQSGERTAKSDADGPCRLFISYRRDESPDFVEHIYSWFASYFGRENVFMDFEGIPAGSNFPEYIQAEVERCDGLVAIIGEHWFRRLMDGLCRTEPDYVREEIKLALKLNKLVVPICIKGAPFPEMLPEEVRGLLASQCVRLDSGRHFARNIEDILVEIQGVLAKRIAHKKLVDEGEIISPAGGVGLGYYKNFVKPVVGELGKLARLSIGGEKYEIGGPGRGGTRLHIMIPSRLYLLDPSVIKPLSASLKQASIQPDGASRPLTMHAWRTGDEYQLIDFPNAITVVQDWLERRMSQMRLDAASEEARRMEREELDRFESTLNWWITDQANGADFCDRVKVLHLDAAPPQLQWLAEQWIAASKASPAKEN
jgi:hypothetical protein